MSNINIQNLIENPSLAKDFDEKNLWDSLSLGEWAALLSQKPEFACKFREIDKLDAPKWAEFIESVPKLQRKPLIDLAAKYHAGALWIIKNKIEGYQFNWDFFKKIPFEKISTEKFAAMANSKEEICYYDLSEVKFRPFMIKRPWFCNLRACINLNPFELVKMKNLEGLGIPPTDFTGVSFKGVSIKWMDLRKCKVSAKQILECNNFTYAQLAVDFSGTGIGARDISGVDFYMSTGFQYREQFKGAYLGTIHPFDEDEDYDVRPQPPLFNPDNFPKGNSVGANDHFTTLRNGGIIYEPNWEELIRTLPTKKQFLATRPFTKNKETCTDGQLKELLPIEWARLLLSRPELADKCDKFELFDSEDWSKLLAKHPQFADKCDKWDEFDKNETLALLKAQPQLADKCDKLHEFTSKDWFQFLEAQPQLSEKAKKHPSGWAGLLCIKPELAGNCDKWNEFYSADWSTLLAKQPQFADKCDKWREFDKNETLAILKAQPQLVDKCDELYEFTAKDWNELLETQPQLADEAKKYPSGWAGLLCIKPEIAGGCDKWSKFISADWNTLLKAQPQFADERDKWQKFDTASLKAADSFRRKKDMKMARTLHVEAMTKILEKRLKEVKGE